MPELTKRLDALARLDQRPPLVRRLLSRRLGDRFEIWWVGEWDAEMAVMIVHQRLLLGLN